MLSLSFPLADSFTLMRKLEACRTVSKREDPDGMALPVLFSNTWRYLQTLSNSNAAMLEKRQIPEASVAALWLWGCGTDTFTVGKCRVRALWDTGLTGLQHYWGFGEELQAGECRGGKIQRPDFFSYTCGTALSLQIVFS